MQIEVGAIYNEGGQILLDSSCKFYNNNAGFDYKSTEPKIHCIISSLGDWLIYGLLVLICSMVLNQ